MFDLCFWAEQKITFLRDTSYVQDNILYIKYTN